MMSQFAGPDDRRCYFDADVWIYTAEQGSRSAPPFLGIRWDFTLAEDPLASRLFCL